MDDGWNGPGVVEDNGERKVHGKKVIMELDPVKSKSSEFGIVNARAAHLFAFRSSKRLLASNPPHPDHRSSKGIEGNQQLRSIPHARPCRRCPPTDHPTHPLPPATNRSTSTTTSKPTSNHPHTHPHRHISHSEPLQPRHTALKQTTQHTFCRHSSRIRVRQLLNRKS